MANLESISLFSNCGAGDVGFARAGFRFRVLAEIDERRLDVATDPAVGVPSVPGNEFGARRPGP